MAFSPIEQGFSTPTKPLPLGIPISHRVSINPIRGQLANQIHAAHHSYVSDPRNGVLHHGVFLDGDIVGAITYDYMLASEPIHGYESDEYIEVARVTVANDTPNLASCGLAQSQDAFIESYAEEHEIGLLVTYVREDYEGSMFKALRGKGWEHDGHIAEGHQAGNRTEREIREWDKKRWVCELD
jgi:hypothetical protein